MPRMIAAARATGGVLVVGMHRSGSSAAARSLNLMGLSVCRQDDLVPDLIGNERGHWESASLVTFNDRLLARVGRAWWFPPQVGAWEALSSSLQAQLAECRTRFDRVHEQSPWVWKDPRTSLTLPLWLSALGSRVLGLVFCFRNPLEVADSLATRNQFPQYLSICLWERYNRHLLAGM